MWHWILCYLSGQHEYGVSCEPGEIYLRCRGCGRRSSGWELRDENTAARVHAHGARVPALLQAQAVVRRQHYSA